MAIEAGRRIQICVEHGPSCQLDYPFRLMGQFDVKRALLRPRRAGRVGIRIVRIKNGSIEGHWAVYPNNYLLGSPTAIKPTRAQAAQAAYK